MLRFNRIRDESLIKSPRRKRNFENRWPHYQNMQLSLKSKAKDKNNGASYQHSQAVIQD